MIIQKALEEPVRQIAINAGLEGSVIVDKIISSEQGMGFDVLAEEYVNMNEAGIVDPAKVTFCPTKRCISSCYGLTTESLVSDIPEPEPAMPAGGGMPGMM